MNWLFDDPPNVAVFTTKLIAAQQQPVLLVTHDDDGAWQFLPLKGELRIRDAAVVSLRSMIERDRTLAELADLPVGWRAWRESQDSPWLRKQIEGRYFPLTEVYYSKPEGAEERSSAPAVPVRSEAFEELVEAATNYLADCQHHLEQEYHLGKWSRYDWSQETRQLVFSDRGAPKVIADIQFVGSVSTETDTWLWAWDNDSVDPRLFEALLRIRQYGEAHGFPHLTTPRWYAHEVDGWEMTSIAAFLLRAKGAYRSPRENGFTFMIITSIGLAT